MQVGQVCLTSFRRSTQNGMKQQPKAQLDEEERQEEEEEDGRM